MWETLVARMKASMRFPKRSTADLRWLKNVWIAFGIVWLAIGLFGWSGWPAVFAVLLGVGWFVQTALTVKEIRRRQQETTVDQPPGPRPVQ
jgi:fatty acid desaturase